MNIQIIHNQHDFFTVAIMDFHQLTQEMGKIQGCSGVSQLYHSLASQRFKRNKQIGHTAAAVFIILSLWISGLWRNTPLLNELPVRLIQADHRAQRIIRTLIYIQNVLHPRYKLRPWFWDAPLLFLPRLKFVFFSVSMTAVSEMLSTTPSRTSSSAISCSVHRSRPSGASEQAMAMM